MLDFVTILTSDWFWIAVGAVGAIITLVLTYQEIRRTELRAGSDFLLRLVQKWESSEMQKKRREIVEILAKTPEDFGKMEECKDVFNFFEDLGLLLRMKVIPKRLVWSDFCYWILPYWQAFEKYVEWTQKADHTNYIEFGYLFKQIYAYDNWMRNPSALGRFFKIKKPVEIDDEDVEDLLEEERHLGKSKNKSSHAS